MKYEKAQANIVLFANDDVIRTSGETNGYTDFFGAIGGIIKDFHDSCDSFSHQCGNADDVI